MSNSLQPYALWPTRLLCPWDSPGKNTGVGCHALLQGIFLTQGSNPHSLLLMLWQAGSLSPILAPLSCTLHVSPTLYLYSLQGDFAAFHIKSLSPYSLLLNLDWPCNLFGVGKCNRSDGVVCQFNPRSQVPSLPLSAHSLGSLSSHYENNHGLPAGWWKNTQNQDEQPQQKPFWTKQPPADLVADYRHKLQSPAHTNDQQNHLKIFLNDYYFKPVSFVIFFPHEKS